MFLNNYIYLEESESDKLVIFSGSSEWGAIMADTVIGLCMGSKTPHY